MDESTPTPQDDFMDQVSKKQRRKEQARRDRSDLWFGMGMFGLVGWSVAIPTVLFLALGIWIDERATGPYSWTLMLLVVGVAVGCANAWYWVRRERP